MYIYYIHKIHIYKKIYNGGWNCMICHLQAGDLEKPVVWFQSGRIQSTWRPVNQDLPGHEKINVLDQAVRDREEKKREWSRCGGVVGGRERVRSTCLCLSVLFEPSWIQWCPPTLGRIICFTQFTNSKGELFSSGNTLTDMPRINV